MTTTTISDGDLYVIARAAKRSRDEGKLKMRVTADAIHLLGGKIPKPQRAQFESWTPEDDDEDLERASKLAQRAQIICEMPVDEVQGLVAAKLSKKEPE